MIKTYDLLFKILLQFCQIFTRCNLHYAIIPPKKDANNFLRAAIKSWPKVGTEGGGVGGKTALQLYIVLIREISFSLILNRCPITASDSLNKFLVSISICFK